MVQVCQYWWAAAHLGALVHLCAGTSTLGDDLCTVLPTPKGTDETAKPRKEFSENEPFEGFNFLYTLAKAEPDPEDYWRVRVYYTWGANSLQYVKWECISELKNK